MLMMLARLRGFLQESPADAHDACPVCEGFCRQAQLMLMMLAPFARVSAGKLQKAELMLMMLALFARVCAGSPADAHDSCPVCEGFCGTAAGKPS